MKTEFKKLWKRTFRNMKRNASTLVMIFGISFITALQQAINGVAVGASVQQAISYIALNLCSTWGVYIGLVVIVMTIVYAILAHHRSKGSSKENGTK